MEVVDVHEVAVGVLFPGDDHGVAVHFVIHAFFAVAHGSKAVAQHIVIEGQDAVPLGVVAVAADIGLGPVGQGGEAVGLAVFRRPGL